jgi:hypothetical protein
MLRAGELSTEYIQAAGLPDTMTVEIRKPGGERWGVDWVRYTVGHPHAVPEPLDVPIPPTSTRSAMASWTVASRQDPHAYHAGMIRLGRSGVWSRNASIAAATSKGVVVCAMSFL